MLCMYASIMLEWWGLCVSTGGSHRCLRFVYLYRRQLSLFEVCVSLLEGVIIVWGVSLLEGVIFVWGLCVSTGGAIFVWGLCVSTGGSHHCVRFVCLYLREPSLCEVCVSLLAGAIIVWGVYVSNIDGVKDHCWKLWVSNSDRFFTHWEMCFSRCVSLL